MILVKSMLGITFGGLGNVELEHVRKMALGGDVSKQV